MICPKCRTANLEAAVYCAGCGRPLLRGPGRRRVPRFTFLLVLGGAAVLVSLYFLYRMISPGPEAGAARGGEGGSVAALNPQPVSNAFLPTLGEFIVRGAGGREIFRTTGAVFGAQWAALPVAVLFGGENLTFQEDGSAAARVVAGTWAAMDPVVFWKVDCGYAPAPLDLAPWKPSQPLDWQPFRSTGPSFRVEVGASRRVGAFTSFPWRPDMRLPGILLQEGALVGWTFGGPIEQAYLWTGEPASGPPPAVGADQMFSAVSPDCREGYFRRQLDSGTGSTPATELETLARGFRLAPLLAPEDQPPDLRQSSVVGRMDALATELIRRGDGDEVIRILDDRTIRDSADPVLARNAVLALAARQDYNRTIRRLETIERDIFAARGPVPAELGELKLRLYKDWLRKIVDNGDYYSGTVAYEEAQQAFPDDPEIRLLGVEIAIAENNPDRARELLEARGYPTELKEQADRLGARLGSNPDGSEDVIVRFDPAADNIEVEAVINGSFRQKFFVDSGASYVTIPSSTAQALKIKMDEGIPVRAIATASGVQVAYEVKLESLELDKCRVDNVTALVMDMPLLPEYGLLGLNFLNAFSAEIDKAGGILRLKKRPQ